MVIYCPSDQCYKDIDIVCRWQVVITFFNIQSYTVQYTFRFAHLHQAHHFTATRWSYIDMGRICFYKGSLEADIMNETICLYRLRQNYEKIEERKTSCIPVLQVRLCPHQRRLALLFEIKGYQFKTDANFASVCINYKRIGLRKKKIHFVSASAVKHTLGLIPHYICLIRSPDTCRGPGERKQMENSLFIFQSVCIHSVQLRSLNRADGCSLQ